MRGYHAFNLAVHVLNAVLVYLLLALTLKTPYFEASKAKGGEAAGRRAACLMVALLFSVHPVQTQAVTYISQRFTSLAALFYLLSLVLYVRARTSGASASGFGAYAFSLVFSLAAMKTKESAFTLPIAAAIYDLMFLEGGPAKRAAYILPLAATMLIVPLGSIEASGLLTGAYDLGAATRIAATEDISRWQYLLAQPRVAATYLRLLLLPINQNIDYDYPVGGPFTAGMAFGLLIVCSSLAGGALLWYRSRARGRGWERLASFGVFWFFLTISVESSIIPLADIIFEHRLYLPSFGFFLAAVSLSYRVSVIRGRAALAVAASLTLLLGFAAYQRNSVWADEARLWEDTAAKSPSKSRPRSILGAVYYEKGLKDEALREARRALELDPENSAARKLMALIYSDLGRRDEAAGLFEKALAADPMDLEARINLANFEAARYVEEGRFEEAEKQYLTALAVRPDDYETYFNLGMLYEKWGRNEEAIATYLAVLKFAPELGAPWIRLSGIYLELGLEEEAIGALEEAISEDPGFAEAHSNLGNIYAGKGMMEEAVAHYERAIALKPGYAPAHNNLGIAYFMLGRAGDAYAEFEAALALDPKDAAARENLEAFKKSLGR